MHAHNRFFPTPALPRSGSKGRRRKWSPSQPVRPSSPSAFPATVSSFYHPSSSLSSTWSSVGRAVAKSNVRSPPALGAAVSAAFCAPGSAYRPETGLLQNPTSDLRQRSEPPSRRRSALLAAPIAPRRGSQRGGLVSVKQRCNNPVGRMKAMAGIGKGALVPAPHAGDST